MLFGKGGDTITKIILEASNVKTVQDKDAVKVDLNDDGQVIIYHTNRDIINKTAEMIKILLVKLKWELNIQQKLLK